MSALTATDRLARLLAVIPWVASQDGVTIDEIARRFSYPEKHLMADLQDVVYFVGVYPFTPDALIEVDFQDDRVWIRYADWFNRPLRLESDEALALLAAGQAVAALALEGPDDDLSPLTRALTKLRAAMGSSADALDVRLGGGVEDVLDALRVAVAEQRRTTIGYYSFGRNEHTTRTIEPQRFFADGGHWYVAAHCRLADGPRVFRLDRITDIAVLDETFDTEHHEPAGLAVAHAPLPEVTIDVDRSEQWIVEQYPVNDVSLTAEGRIEVTLPVAGPAWLDRLLLRLGPDARLIGPDPSALEAQRSAAAARVLARYA